MVSMASTGMLGHQMPNPNQMVQWPAMAGAATGGQMPHPNQMVQRPAMAGPATGGQQMPNPNQMVQRPAMAGPTTGGQQDSAGRSAPGHGHAPQTAARVVAQVARPPAAEPNVHVTTAETPSATMPAAAPIDCAYPAA